MKDICRLDTPQSLVLNHGNNVLRWSPGERLNRLLSHSCRGNDSEKPLLQPTIEWELK